MESSRKMKNKKTSTSTSLQDSWVHSSQDLSNWHLPPDNPCSTCTLSIDSIRRLLLLPPVGNVCCPRPLSFSDVLDIVTGNSVCIYVHVYKPDTSSPTTVTHLLMSHCLPINSHSPYVGKDIRQLVTEHLEYRQREYRWHNCNTK